MGTEKGEKKTFWGRFTSWVAASWPGRVVKWIADHTGISWALGKIKNLFGGRDAGKEDTATPEGTTPKSPKGNGKVLERKVNGPSPEPVTPEMLKEGGQAKFKQYFSCDKDRLLLVVTNEIYQDLKDNYKNKDNEEEFRTIIQCDGENLCITGSYGSLQDVSGGKKAISVTSVKNEKAGEEHIKTELQAMKTKVGLDDNRRFVEITKISPEPFTPEVSSHKSAHAAGNANEAGSSSSQQSPEKLKHNGCITAVNIADREVLRLVLVLNDESFIRDNNIQKEGIYSLYVQCGKNQYMITGSNSPKTKDNNYVSFDVDEVAFENKVYKELLKMKEVLDLNSDKRYVTIDNMFTFTPEVESPANDGQPNPSFTQTTASAAPSGPSL